MKNLILGGIIGLICLFSGNLAAQEPSATTPQLPRPIDLVQKFADKLALNPSQKEQMTALAQKYQGIFAQKRRELPQMDRMKKWQMFKELRQEINNEIKNILTPAQWEQFEKLRAEQKTKMRQAIQDFRQNGGKEKLKTLRTEMQAYQQQNISPIMQKLRGQLETQLSETDRQTLAQLREERQKMQDLSKKIRQTYRNNATPTEADKQALQNLRQQMPTNRQKIKDLAQKYAEQLAQLELQIKDDKARWEQDLKNIVQKHLPNDELRQQIAPQLAHKYRQGMRKGYFLLLEPPSLPANKADLQVYPNPSTYQSTLEFKVKKTAWVKIDLLDKNGNFLKSLTEQQFPSGKHQYTVNIQDLDNGIYYYRLSIGKQTQLKKLVVQK
ncbi:MAG: T9SS type A sorting domain-containing protein [Microscillaceae bacterium]|jgi:hypothetical protein|nr:T9SS type A sorting domain-containing protein [Microscillaceae bacterium]